MVCSILNVALTSLHGRVGSAWRTSSRHVQLQYSRESLTAPKSSLSKPKPHQIQTVADKHSLLSDRTLSTNSAGRKALTLVVSDVLRHGRVVGIRRRILVGGVLHPEPEDEVVGAAALERRLCMEMGERQPCQD